MNSVQNVSNRKGPKQLFFLSAVIAIGLLFRTFYWVKSGGILIRDNNPDIDNYLNISRWIWTGNLSAILEYRPTQLFYPFLLTPAALWNFPIANYVFVLHCILTALTLAFVFLAALKLSNLPLATLTGLLVALNWRMAGWFNWMFTEVCYYFTVAWVIYAVTLVWEKKSPKRLGGWTFACVCAFFTKPEAISLVLGSALTVSYFSVRPSKGPRAALKQVALIATLVVALLTAIVFGIPSVKNAFLSHIHVAHGFWLSTHTGANAMGIEQEQAFRDLGTIAGPGGGPRQPYYLRMSNAGIAFILEHPFRYLWLCILRLTSILFPAIYYQFPPPTRWLDGGFSVVIIFGAILAAFRSHPNQEKLRGIFFLGLSMTLFTSVYLADGDTRFRLPIYLAFSFISMVGWNSIFPFTQVFAQLKQRLVLATPDSSA